MDYKRIHESIMKTDPKIRLVTICDLNGKIMHSEHRQGVKNLLTPEESKKSLELAVKAWKTRSELTSKIGKGKYVLAEYERIKRITIGRQPPSLYNYRNRCRSFCHNQCCLKARLAIGEVKPTYIPLRSIPSHLGTNNEDKQNPEEYLLMQKKTRKNKMHHRNLDYCKELISVVDQFRHLNDVEEKLRSLETDA